MSRNDSKTLGNKTTKNKKGKLKHSFEGQSLREIYALCQKQTIEHIARNLNISKVSSLTKEKLIDHLMNVQYTHYKKAFSNLTTHQLDIVKLLVEHHGRIADNKDDEGLLYFLRSYGIAFPMLYQDEPYLIMPDEHVQFFSQFIMDDELISKINLNTEMINVLSGLLYYYGAVNMTTAVVLLAQMYPDSLNSELELVKLETVILTHAIYTRLFDITDKEISLSAFEDFNVVQLLKYLPSDFDYYPINKFRALQASTPNFIEMTPAFNVLADVIKSIYSDDEIVDFYLHDLSIHMRIGSTIKHYLDLTDEYFLFADVYERELFIPYLIECHNTTRQWKLKGHTPNELGLKKL